MSTSHSSLTWWDKSPFLLLYSQLFCKSERGGTGGGWGGEKQGQQKPCHLRENVFNWKGVFICHHLTYEYTCPRINWILQNLIWLGVTVTNYRTTPDTHGPDFREDRKRCLRQMAAYKGRVAKSQRGLLKKEKSGPQHIVQAASHH